MFKALGSGFGVEGCIGEPIRVSAGLQAFEQRLIGVSKAERSTSSSQGGNKGLGFRV